jgi:sugar/nucleoside kinase (ribokinase family)
MSSLPTVISAGYMPLDIVAPPSGPLARQAGGTAANLAAVLAFFGWDAVLAGQIGRDAAGAEFISDIRRAGVSADQIHRPEGGSTPRLIHSIELGVHTYSYSCPKCRSRFPRSRPLTLDQAQQCIDAHPRASVFFFDRANAGTLLLAEHYHAHGALVVFEPSVPANAETLSRAVAVSKVIKHSDDRTVGGIDSLTIGRPKGQIRIVTHGAGGLELRIGTKGTRRLPAFSSPTLDAGGAGDWTTAGFLIKAASQGRKVELSGVDDALRFGQALAALNCATPGARGLMRLSRRTVLRRAKAVLEEGGLSGKLRLSPPPKLHSQLGTCPMCLMPSADSALAPATKDSVPVAATRLATRPLRSVRDCNRRRI